jgi:hypothetical protein
MQAYKLENKEQDQQFLSGMEVTCRAVLPVSTDSLGMIHKGDSLVIVLSNGKKYKGRIVDFMNVKIENYRIGELVIVKV